MTDTPTEPTISPIDEAKEILTKIEKANIEVTEKTKKLEELHSRTMLSGRAEAGKTPEKKLEETPKEYAQRVMRGDVSKR